jgi:hypothetical protein
VKRIPNLSRINTGVLITVPLILGFIILGIQLSVINKMSSKIVQDILISLTFFFWGMSGIPMIVRKEAPGYLLKGPLAIAQGIVLLVVCWTIAFGVWFYRFLIK